MNAALMYALGTWIIDSALYFLAAVPFEGCERIKKSSIFTMFASVVTLRAAASYIFIAYVPNGMAWNEYFFFAYTVVMLFGYLLCYRIHIVKLLYTMLILILLGTFNKYLSTAIIAPFYPSDENILATPGYLAVVTVLTAAILFFGYRLFKGLIRNAFSTLSNKSILMLCVMPAVFFILINVYASVFRSATEMPRSTKILVNLCIMGAGLISYYINIRMVLDTAKNIQTERRLSEEKALLESLNRTKSEFFGNISHELKTPLTIIVTDMELAEQFINEENLDAAKELIREASHKGMQMADIVTDALAFARGQETARPMEKIDYSAVFVSTLAVFEPLIIKHGNTLKRDIDKLPPIIGSVNGLADALINLLFNANRHTAGGIIKVKWKENNGKYTLTVSDTGSGIPPELLPRVFERGVTGGSGTGLGLALVKSVVEAHDGEAAIESKAGEGTTVTLVFPATAEDEI